MKYRYLVLILCLLNMRSYAMSPESKAMGRVTNQHIQAQVKKEGVSVFGTGGRIPEKIEGIHVHFNLDRSLKVDQVRRLVVNGVEDFLEIINSDKEIRPYLGNYPFTVRNIEYRVGFGKTISEYVAREYVAYVTVMNGNIYYRSRDKEKRAFCDSYQETYEEAKRIVEQEESK